mgnify:CR=1 FL=1
MKVSIMFEEMRMKMKGYANLDKGDIRINLEETKEEGRRKFQKTVEIQLQDKSAAK